MVVAGPEAKHLRLEIPQVPPSYGGRLYFVVGPGLGDTVNDFRILHEVTKLYHNAKPVVYVDSRWKDLCRENPDLQGVTIRYHSEAPSPMSDGRERTTPYYQTFQAIIDEVTAESMDCHGRVVLGGFKCVDQLARKEPNIAMKARAVGLSLAPERCRPFFPLSQDDLASSGQFLKEHGMHPGSYVAVAPYTTADKMWFHESWESVITRLQGSTSLPVLIVGDQGGPPFRGATVHDAIGLPLRLIAGLLARARCFIGLDSGLTHLAACFDVPIVTLNPQGKFPPFLVEAHSPFRWTHLTPRVYGNRPISAESVLEIVHKTLICSAPPPCPLCNALPYVLGATKRTVLFLCRCGLMYRDPEDTRKEVTPTRIVPGEFPLPRSREGLLSLPAGLGTKMGPPLNRSDDEAITVTFDHWSPLEVDPEGLISGPEPCDLWWTWDAMYAFLDKRGYRIRESSIRTAPSGSGALFAVTVKAVPRSAANHDVDLRIPWGRKIFDMKQSLYERWLSWESFQKLDELEGLGWHLANEGAVEDGRDILRLAFILGHRPRTIERLLRITFKSFWNSVVGGR